MEFKIEVIRHDQKAKTKQPDLGRPLTEEGYKHARQRGEKLRGELPEISRVRHSALLRTRQTAEALLLGFDGLPDPEKIEQEPGLGIDMQEMFSPQSLMIWKEMVVEGEAAPVRWFLDYGKEQPDEQTWSPYRVASGLASVICKAIDEAKQSGRAQSYEFMVSHSGYIEALIKFLAAEQIAEDPVVAEQQHIVDQIGGIIEMGERGAVIKYVEDEGQEYLTLGLRGKEYKVEIDQLRNMAA